MILGMTRGEIALTAFIFLLVWGAGKLPGLGGLLGTLLFRPRGRGASLPPAAKEK